MQGLGKDDKLVPSSEMDYVVDGNVMSGSVSPEN